MDQVTSGKSKGSSMSCIDIERHQSQDGDRDSYSPNILFRQRYVTKEESYELQWSRSGNGVNAVGKCIVIDLFDNDTDARNYEEAFKAVGFEVEFMDHPSDKVKPGRR